MIGETVKDFVITAELGRGGMGEVFVGEQRIIKTKVAIKMLLPAISRDEGHVQRFFNEAVAAGKIPHAGVVKIFDVGFHTGRAYLVMEFLTGEVLAKRIAAGRLPLPQVLAIARQVASVLEATHAAGITHRDLKPDNVFLVPDAELGERVKVLDFGIAKLGDRSQTAADTTMGTPAYMAPELWGDAAQSDGRTDVYALGCMLFQLCCGRVPFPVTTFADACAKHTSETPPRARSLAPELPAALDDLIARMLEKRIADRPTAADVSRALAAIGTVPAVAVTQPPARSKTPVIAAITLAVVGSAVVYAVTRGGDPEPPPPAPKRVDPIASAPAVDAAPAIDAAPVAQQAAAAGLVLSYRVMVQPTDGAEFRPVAPNEALRTGMHVAFEVMVSESAHVFVAQRTKRKELGVLFPHPRIAVANPLPANVWLRIPPEKSFRLNDQDIGTETVYLVASRTPPASLALAVQTQGRAQPAAVEQEIVHVAMDKRGDCAGRPRNLVLDGDDKDCRVGTRGLELDDETHGIPARRVRAVAADDVVFVPFTYQHLRKE